MAASFLASTICSVLSSRTVHEHLSGLTSCSSSSLLGLWLPMTMITACCSKLQSTLPERMLGGSGSPRLMCVLDCDQFPPPPGARPWAACWICASRRLRASCQACGKMAGPQPGFSRSASVRTSSTSCCSSNSEAVSSSTTLVGTYEWRCSLWRRGRSRSTISTYGRIAAARLSSETISMLGVAVPSFSNSRSRVYSCRCGLSRSTSYVWSSRSGR
mmetsp:Transcript_45070/g.111719  ORF Transcript_45070/g.111719 Transcript_45070/m.111719 type:complete len:216 (+) Transcript_45070:244-891(+)